MIDPTPQSTSVNPIADNVVFIADTMTYIADITKQFATLANRVNCFDLGYILGMAALEAHYLATHAGKSRHKRY